jgi:threonine dehydratase
MAVALAAKICGTQAHVVVPQNTPACKTKAIEGYGARLIYSGNSMAEREAKAAEVQAATGAVRALPCAHYLWGPPSECCL